MKNGDKNFVLVSNIVIKKQIKLNKNKNNAKKKLLQNSLLGKLQKPLTYKTTLIYIYV